LAVAEMEEEGIRLLRLREHLLARLVEDLDGVHLNGSRRERLPGNLNISFDGIGPNRLLSALTVVAVSSGSACSSADTGPSRVLAAIGVSEGLAAASLRIGLGRFTTEEEIDFAADKIIEAVVRLRD